MSTAPVPTEITVHQASRTLTLRYGAQSYQLPFEFLRVLSPSAEVRGHGPGQETLQTGKRLVDIKGVVGMLDQRHTQPARREARHQPLDEGGLAAPRPS